MLRLTILCLTGLCVASCGDDRSTPVGPTPTSAPPTLGSPTFRASGTVFEIGGGPVAGAVVSVRSCDDTPSYNYTFGQSRTDALGGFQLEVSSGSESPVGCVYLQVVKNGYVGALLESPRSIDGLAIKIQRLREVTGRVVEVEGGPVSGVALSNWTGPSGPEATSNASGFFAVNDVGKYLSLNKAGYVWRAVDVPEGQAVDLGTVYLQRAITLAAGSRVSSRISSADIPYELYDQGAFCSPCKWIDLKPGQQNLSIQLTWSGDVPLTIWAGTDYYGSLEVAAAKNGESPLTVSVPAATTVVLVGVRSNTFTQQSVAQPVPFELTAAVQ